MSSASPSKSSKKGEKKPPVFPVGIAAQRVLRKTLRNAKKGKTQRLAGSQCRLLVTVIDTYFLLAVLPGAEVIKTFQQDHSLHTMIASAFDTQPRYHAPAQTRSKGKETVESLDTDSVLEFLSHLGVSHHKVNQRICDSLLKQLEDEIRQNAWLSVPTDRDIIFEAPLTDRWNRAVANLGVDISHLHGVGGRA